MGSAQRAFAMARCVSRIAGVTGGREPGRLGVSLKVLFAIGRLVPQKRLVDWRGLGECALALPFIASHSFPGLGPLPTNAADLLRLLTG
jgi:hypothetical protein